MTKTDVSNALAVKLEVTKKDAKVILDGVLEVITEGLVNEKEVQLTGFGTFLSREMKGREGRNPRKPDEVVDIEAREQAFFRAGRHLKDAINPNSKKKKKGKK